MVPITDRCLRCAMCQALFLKVDSSLYFMWGGIYDDQFLPTLFDKPDDATICLKFCVSCRRSYIECVTKYVFLVTQPTMLLPGERTAFQLTRWTKMIGGH